MRRVRAKAAGSADGDADQRKASSLPQDQAEHVAALRAKRHANADLLGALSDDVRDDAVDADGSESKSEDRECSEKNHDEAARGDGFGDDAFHGLIAVDHLLTAHLPAGPTDGVEDRREVSVVTHGQAGARGDHRDEVVRHLHAGDVDLRAQRLGVIEIEPPLLHVADDTDDLQLSSAAVHDDAFADGVLVRKESAREDVVDDGDERRVLIVLRGEEAPALERDVHHVEIAGLDDVVDGPVHAVFIRWFWLTVEPEELFVVARHGQVRPIPVRLL